MSDDDRARAADRLHIVDGLIAAIDDRVRVDGAIAASRSKHEAATALQAPPFAFSEVQAQYVLTMQLHRRTMQARDELTEEREHLIALLEGTANPTS